MNNNVKYDIKNIIFAGGCALQGQNPAWESFGIHGPSMEERFSYKTYLNFNNSVFDLRAPSGLREETPGGMGPPNVPKALAYAYIGDIYIYIYIYMYIYPL